MDVGGLTRHATHAAWLLLSLPDALAYRRALRSDVARVQRDVLRGILRRNATTDFGRAHAFSGIASIEEFRSRVPLSTYDDYAEAIAHIGAGRRNVLTSSVVRLLEPTSGSTAPTKLVPYTRELERQFQRAIAPWVVDLFARHPRLLRGKAYWSISPVANVDRRTLGGIPIGFADDAGYLGRLEGTLLRSVLAVPSAVRHVTDVDTFRYTTLLFLLRSRALALISVWSPSFLVLLCGPLSSWWPDLACDIELGTLTPPGPIDPAVHRVLVASLRPDSRRAAEIRAIYAATDDRATIHARLWPELEIISCWTQAAAANHVRRLGPLFPGVSIQPKGLIATESIVSIPIGSGNQHTLAVRSHFFEFLDQGAKVHLAHELQPGETYEIVVTTDVFYRYRLHDLVRVVGHMGSVPALEFLGKTDAVVDQFGEKLDEQHVRAAIHSATSNFHPPPTFAMLAFEPSTGGYALYLEWPAQSDAILMSVADAVEAALRANFHYAYCRKLGQLAPVKAFRIAGGGLEAYVAACLKSGQRLGDIKPSALHRATTWSSTFDAAQCGLSREES